MRYPLGIRHEDKYEQERRSPLTPEVVRRLIREENLSITVESSEQRIFADREYREAGARVAPDLADCPTIFGVKEIPVDALEQGKTYVFFSHVTKGQPYNMPMLKRMMELECNHIDYERISDDKGRRLIFFGRFAGLAGMIDSLWSLGERWARAGYETPFSAIQQSLRYSSLAEAKAAVAEAGRCMAAEGLPEALGPVTLGFTGYGNVSKGAQEMAELLPLKRVAPADLLSLERDGNADRRSIYASVFEEKDLVERTDGHPFDLTDYYENPQAYRPVFHRYLPHLTVLMNCMYWDERYPRIVTRDDVRRLSREGPLKLTVIGDITCDPGGSIEIMHRSTTIEDPVYVVDPRSLESRPGFDGDGILVMAVDILPSELPRDSSEAFSEALSPFVRAIAEADFSKPTEAIGLPDPLRKALILHRGRLTPEYADLASFVS